MSSLDNIWKDKRLSLSIIIHVYLALVQSVLLYASETWTLTVVDSKTLDAFHMKCQRRILGIWWHQFVRNEEITARTGLPSLSTTICCRRSAIFGHLARLGDEVPAHKALHSCVRLSQGRLPDPTWKRRPRDRWIDQLRERKREREKFICHISHNQYNNNFTQRQAARKENSIAAGHLW